MQNYNPQLNFGFTIIEILVAITIIFLLISLGFAGYASFNQRQTLITAGQNLKNIIRDAQSRAFNNESDCTPGVCDCSTSYTSNMVGWYVDFSRNSIYGMCGTKEFSEKAFGLAAEITIVPVPTSGVRVLYRSSPPSVDQPVQVCLSKANLDNSYYSIVINSAGVVTDTGSIAATCP